MLYKSINLKLIMGLNYGFSVLQELLKFGVPSQFRYLFSGSSGWIHRTRKMQFFGGSDISPLPPPPTASGNNAHMMYVFNKNGVCLLYREWNRSLRTLNAQQDHKLMFGLLFSLKSLTAKMDPTRYIFFS